MVKRSKFYWVLFVSLIVALPAKAQHRQPVPDCHGKVCGPDGCGGSCGTCPDGAVCVGNFCQRDCAFIPDVGCCQGNNLVTCENGKPHVIFCKNHGGADTIHHMPTVCGWDSYEHKYSCLANLDSMNGVGYAPSDYVGGHPLWCHSQCVPYCGKKECGSDGCGGSCGSCAEGLVCNKGKCVHPVPEPVPDTAEDVHVAEPVPDTAEDVHVAEDVHFDRDAIEAADPGLDSGKPGKDVQKDRKIAKDTSKDITGHQDTTRDRHAVDATGPDTQTKSSGGGCSTGPGSASGTWLIFLSLLTLLWRRRQGE